jgi:hypothetical protein
MRHFESEVIGGLFWLGVGIFFACAGLNLKMGSLHNPGPGFLPIIISLILIFFGLVSLAKGLIRPEKPVEEILWIRPLFTIASVFFYGLLLGFIGFLLSTFILMFILFGLLMTGKRKWLRVLFYSTVIALAAWLVFSVALKVPFPSPSLRAILS